MDGDIIPKKLKKRALQKVSASSLGIMVLSAYTSSGICTQTLQDEDDDDQGDDMAKMQQLARQMKLQKKNKKAKVRICRPWTLDASSSSSSSIIISALMTITYRHESVYYLQCRSLSSMRHSS